MALNTIVSYNYNSSGLSQTIPVTNVPDVITKRIVVNGIVGN